MAYVPNQGDLIWLTFNPQAGHEQAGRRPVLVLSPASYNGKVGLAILCPITNQEKGYPFEVKIPAAEYIDQLPARIHKQVLARLSVLLEV